ncbi:MAG: efflux transporter periplasmic adaptor subunit, partial [Prevotellaceae bacterium]|nr:efflux transporter periplasmic adaptor subunit [Prevotellaceae bacterium]
MKTKKYLKTALLVVIAALFVWTFVFLYRKSRPEVTEYETVAAQTMDLEKSTVVTGKVEPRDEVLIKPQISGIISEVLKEAGQSVRKDEVIAKVKVIPELGTLNSAESRVRLAEINAKQAETDFARTEKLYHEQLVSAEEYEKEEVNLKQQQEELVAARDNLQIVKEGITQNSASYSSTFIRSTIDGLILDVPIKVGNSVIMSNTFNDGTTIATVANMNDLIFRGNIDETEVGLIRE